MKKITFLLMFLLLTKVGNAQTFKWAKQLSGTSSTATYSVDVKDIISRNGEVYVCGSFTGTVDFDMGTGVSNKTANGTDFFVARYDADGDLTWITTSNLAGNEEMVKVNTGTNVSGASNHLIGLIKVGTNGFRLAGFGYNDGIEDFTSSTYTTSAGNLFPTSFDNANRFYYVVGAYQNTLTVGNLSVSSVGGSDGFCLRIDLGLGNVFTPQNLRSYGNTSSDIINDVVLDNATNLRAYLVGSFYGTMNLEYANGTPFSVTSSGMQDGIVLELLQNSTSDLRPQDSNSIMKLGSTGNDAILTVDYANSIFYIGGYFSETVDFDPNTAVATNRTSSGLTDSFVAGYVVSAAIYPLRFVNIEGNATTDERTVSVSAATLSNTSLTHNVYSLTQRANTFGGIFTSLRKTDEFGNINAAFGGLIVSTANDKLVTPRGVFDIANDDVYLAGNFNGTADFNTDGLATFNMTALNSATNGFTNNGFVEKFGNCTQSASAPTITASSSTNICSGSSVTLTASGSMYNNAKWVWYSGSCGGTLVGEGPEITVSPTSNTTYFARGEGGCVGDGVCSTAVNVNVTPLPTNGYTQAGNTITTTNSEPATLYSWIDCSNNAVVASGATMTSYTPTVSGNYKFRINNGATCFIESACISVTVLSANDFSKLGVKLYPNPVTNSFTIEGEVVVENVIIYNLLGQELKTFSNTNSFNVEDLQSGTYLVQVTTERGTAQTKIIKN